MLGIISQEEGVAEWHQNRKAIGRWIHKSQHYFILNHSSIHILSLSCVSYYLWPVTQQEQMASTAKVMHLCSLSLYPPSQCCSKIFKSSIFVVSQSTGYKNIYMSPTMTFTLCAFIWHCGFHSDIQGMVIL